MVEGDNVQQGGDQQKQDLVDALGNVGANLAHNWSMGRTLAAKLAMNNSELRKFGGFLIMAADAIMDLIKSQRTLNALFLRTGRDIGFAGQNLMNAVNQSGLSLKESTELLVTTFMAGLNKQDGRTLELLADLQLLGVDTRKAAQMTAMNRHVLGMSVNQSVELTKATFESSQSYKLSTTAVIDAINSLRETLKTATVTYGPSVANAIQKAMPALLTTFGQESAGEINKVVSALLSGGPKSAELAARLNIPLADLNVKSSGDVVNLIARAVSEMQNIVGPLRGQPGSEFSIPALVAAFGNVPEISLLGIRQAEMVGELKKANLAATADSMRAATFETMINDIRRNLIVVLLPLMQFIAGVLKIINGVIRFFTFGLVQDIFSLLGKILGVLTVALLARSVGAGFIGAGVHGFAAGAMPLAVGAMAGGGATIFGRLFIGLMNLVRIFSPVGILLGILVFAIPKLFGWFGSNSDKQLEEQKKQTALMEADQNKVQTDIASQLKAAVRELQGLRMDSEEQSVSNLDALRGVLDVDTRIALGIEDGAAGGMLIPFSSAPQAGTTANTTLNY